MCTGRIDLEFILRAFSRGADGVFIGGCWPGECHYITEGNYLALSTVHLARKMLGLVGAAPERVRLEYVSASEGARFAEVVNDFAAEVARLGAFGRGEGIDRDKLLFKLDHARRMVPYIKLVEREKLRVPVKSIEAYNRFFNSEEFDRLFKSFIGDKFEVSQVLSALRGQPRSPEDLSEMCGMNPSELARHLHLSALYGLVKFDTDRNLVSAV